LEFVQQNPSFG